MKPTGMTVSALWMSGSRLPVLALQLVSVRFILQWLGASEYEQYLLAVLWVGYLALLELGFHAGGQYKLTAFFHRGDWKSAVAVVTTMMLGLSVPILVGFLVLGGHALGWYPLPPQLSASLILAALLMLWVQFLWGIPSAWLSAQNRFPQLAVSDSLNACLCVAGSMVGAYVGRNAESVAWGWFLGSLPMLCVHWIWSGVLREYATQKSRWAKGVFQEVFAYAARTYTHKVATLVGSTADRFLVGNVATSGNLAGAFAAYSLGARIPEVVQGVITPANTVGLPELTRISSEDDPKRLSARIEKNLLVAAAIACSAMLVPAAMGGCLLKVWLGDFTHPGMAHVVVLIAVYRCFEYVLQAMSLPFLAKGIPHLLFPFALFNALTKATLTVPAMLYGGIVAVALVCASIGILQWVPLALMLKKKVDPLMSLRRVLTRIGAILALGFVVAGVLHLYVDSHFVQVNPWLGLLVAVAASVAMALVIFGTKLSPLPDVVSNWLASRKTAQGGGAA